MFFETRAGLQVKSFHPNAGSVSSILKGIVSGPDSMLETLLAAGEFHKATQLMTIVVTVLNQHPSQVTSPDTWDAVNRAEVGAHHSHFRIKIRYLIDFGRL